MTAKLYDAYQIDESNRRSLVGRVAIDGGKLSIVNLANEADRAFLDKSLNEFNNRPFLVKNAAPEGDERYGLGAKEFERGDRGFDELLIQKLESSHSIHLESAR